MLELKVNYEDLVEMPIEKAKEIVSQMDNEFFIEEISCTFDGVKYGIHLVDEGNWEDGGKYQYRTDIGLLYEVDNDGKVVMYDVAVTQDITRSGSYFSEYYYEYEPLQVNKVINKVIPQQIIPEREKESNVSLSVTRSDINKIMMLQGDYKAIEYWESIIMSKVIHGTLHNSYAELTMWMTGITDG